MKRIVVYWCSKNKNIIRKIRERFGIDGPTSLNGETVAMVNDSDIELLKETEKRGFIQLRNK